MGHYSDKKNKLLPQKRIFLLRSQHVSETGSWSAFQCMVSPWLLLWWNGLFSLALTSCSQFELNSGVWCWPTSCGFNSNLTVCEPHLVLTPSHRHGRTHGWSMHRSTGPKHLVETLWFVFGRPDLTHILPGLSERRKSLSFFMTPRCSL